MGKGGMRVVESGGKVNERGRGDKVWGRARDKGTVG